MMRMSFRSAQTSKVRRAVCFAAILLGAACWLTTGAAATAATPIGWAVVNGKGVESTTGGGDGKVVTARTAKELADYASSKEPLTILIEGTCGSSRHFRRSNLSEQRGAYAHVSDELSTK
jgi:pectate lyase